MSNFVFLKRDYLDFGQLDISKLVSRPLSFLGLLVWWEFMSTFFGFSQKFKEISSKKIRLPCDQLRQNRCQSDILQCCYFSSYSTLGWSETQRHFACSSTSLPLKIQNCENIISFRGDFNCFGKEEVEKKKRMDVR